MSGNWENCPRCGSNSVEVKGKLFFFLILFGTGSVLFWFGLLFSPLMVISISLVIASPISFFFPPVHQCNDCKKSWTPKKKVSSAG